MYSACWGRCLVGMHLLASPVLLFLLKAVDFSLVFLSSSISIYPISQSQPYRDCQTWLQRKQGKAREWAQRGLCRSPAERLNGIIFFKLQQPLQVTWPRSGRTKIQNEIIWLSCSCSELPYYNLCTKEVQWLPDHSKSRRFRCTWCYIAAKEWKISLTWEGQFKHFSGRGSPTDRFWFSWSLWFKAISTLRLVFLASWY